MTRPLRLVLVAVLAVGVGAPGAESSGRAGTRGRPIDVRASRTGGPADASITSLTVDPANAKTLYASTDRTVFKSVDAGRSWRAAGNGLEGRVLALELNPRNPQTVYAGTGGGIFKSTDGGDSWRAMNRGLFVGQTQEQREWRLAEGWVTDLAVDPRRPQVLYAITYFCGLIKSGNGGGTWRGVTSGLGALWVNALAVGPRSTRTLYAGTSASLDCSRARPPKGGVFKSTNAGGRWRATALRKLNVNTLVVDPLNPTTVFAGTDRGVFVSRNGGATWRAGGRLGGARVVQPHVGNGVATLAVDPKDPKIVFAANERGVFKSTNRGRSWRAVNAGLPSTRVVALALDPLTPQVAYAGTLEKGVYKTTDGGARWHAANGT